VTERNLEEKERELQRMGGGGKKEKKKQTEKEGKTKNKKHKKTHNPRRGGGGGGIRVQKQIVAQLVSKLFTFYNSGLVVSFASQPLGNTTSQLKPNHNLTSHSTSLFNSVF